MVSYRCKELEKVKNILKILNILERQLEIYVCVYVKL